MLAIAARAITSPGFKMPATRRKHSGRRKPAHLLPIRRFAAGLCISSPQQDAWWLYHCEATVCIVFTPQCNRNKRRRQTLIPDRSRATYPMRMGKETYEICKMFCYTLVAICCLGLRTMASGSICLLYGEASLGEGN